MNILEARAALDLPAAGREMHELITELYPICRSITGNGVRATLDRIGALVPLERHEVPTGTQVLDWTVPREWNIRDAYVKDSTGRRVIDFRRSNLHVVSYSIPVQRTLSLEELRPHLFSMPDRPDWIPYRTSYYKESWGFCLAHRDLEALPEGQYEVCIDSTLEPGSLTYAECVLSGETGEEVLISCHVCHPSLCNDNLSGIAVATSLARLLGTVERRYTYRFLFVPGTIGSITWLSRNEDRLDRIRHGLVLTGVGDPGPFTYKRSRRGDAEIDRVAAYVLERCGQPYRLLDFYPYGYDERQYCSPGFDLPVGCFMRSQHGTYPEYHTSADNPEFVTPAALGDSLATCLDILGVLEANRRYVNQSPKGEPQLGRRGLYKAMGGEADPGALEMAMLWLLSLSDGRLDLVDIASRSGVRFSILKRAADLLASARLLAEQ